MTDVQALDLFGRSCRELRIGAVARLRGHGHGHGRGAGRRADRAAVRGLVIKSAALEGSVSLRSQTQTLFLTSAISAIVLVAPPPRLGVAVELLVLAAVSGAALFVLDRRAGHVTDGLPERMRQPRTRMATTFASKNL